MNRRALVLAGALAALVAGCGGSAQVQPAPPIRPVERPLTGPLREELSALLGVPSGGSQWTTQTSVDTICVSGGRQQTCSSAQAAASIARLQRRQRLLRPARAETPQVVAELSLRGGGTLELVAWWTPLDRLCLAAAPRLAGGASGPFGPCTSAAGLPQSPLSRCDAICLGPVQLGFRGTTYALAGLVDRRATTLRVGLAGGRVLEFPLRGPLFRGRRIFMAELGTRDWRTLELLDGRRVAAAHALPHAIAAAEDCQTRDGTDIAALDACLRRATGHGDPP